MLGQSIITKGDTFTNSTSRYRLWFHRANTTYGKIGVKVWIYKGEVLPVKKDKKGKVESADVNAEKSKI